MINTLAVCLNDTGLEIHFYLSTLQQDNLAYKLGVLGVLGDPP